MITNRDFEIIEPMKKGGQKEVYLVRHNIYEVCVLKQGKCLHSSSLERIKREVEILKDIDSTYFPKNYEFEYKDNGEFFIIEEYINSKTLGELRDNYINDEKKVLNLVLNLVEGLKLLWNKNIVHRDLKPDNILIRDDGQPVIIDLGIARILDDKSLTLTIQLNGPCTPVYASPEQLRNSKGSIDVRTDFFALGIIITELILGKHPFSTEVVEDGLSTLDNLIGNKYKLEYNGIKLSKKLQILINKLLSVEPYQRLRTYTKLQSEINNILYEK